MITLSLFTAIGCSRDNGVDESTSANLKTKLIGKWYFADPAIYGTSNNNSFTFTTDNKVTYKFGSGASDYENGTYSVDGDKLTMTYPQNVTLTYVQKVVFLTDTKVEFVATGKAGEEPYDGTYYKSK